MHSVHGLILLFLCVLLIIAGKPNVASNVIAQSDVSQPTVSSSTMQAAAPTTRTGSRTSGKIHYERLPTGEVVASLVDEGPSTSSASLQTTGRPRQSVVDSSSCVLPPNYPINRSNVGAVVEEAHRATQSMRILLTSMREELRRAGGVATAGGVAADNRQHRWTDSQLKQRRNIAQRLAVAYQSYRKSIHDIENLRFRCSGNSAADGISATGNSSASRPQRAEARQGHTGSDAGSSTNQVIDLTM